MGKYYTVTYEDLAHGLECEVKKDGEWTKWSFNLDSPFLTFVNLVLIAKYIKYGEVRCKYLDWKDIEECGWDKDLDHFRRFELNQYVLFINADSTIEIKESHSYERHGTKLIGHHTIFEGKINNKSELKRIMKQVGIS